MILDELVRNPGPCRVVAEISNAHNGRETRAHDLVSAAADVGCAAVKFQCYTPDELVRLRGAGPAPDPWGRDGWTMRDLYEKAQTPLSWFPRLAEQCDDLGVLWFSSVFGEASLAVLEVLGCRVYKLSSLESRSIRLRNLVRATGKPIIRSSPLDRPPQHRDNEAVLYCPPGYPQDRIEMRLLRKFAGLSYHGTNPLVPALAQGYGARLVEVHVQLDDEPSELEKQVCLTMSQVGQLVELLRATA